MLVKIHGEVRRQQEPCQGCAPSTVVSTFMASNASPLGFSAKSWPCHRTPHRPPQQVPSQQGSTLTAPAPCTCI